MTASVYVMPNLQKYGGHDLSFLNCYFSHHTDYLMFGLTYIISIERLSDGWHAATVAVLFLGKSGCSTFRLEVRKNLVQSSKTLTAVV